MQEIPEYSGSLPQLTTKQMIEVDRAMIEDYGIRLIQMMENAGRNLSFLAKRRFLFGNLEERTVIVLAGTGGNGGGALVCARHLMISGVKVKIVCTRADSEFRPIPQHQLRILRNMNARIMSFDDPEIDHNADLVIDGLIGYSLSGAPRGVAANLIQWANHQPAPILSLDVPSGIDTMTGSAYIPAIKAHATMTLALPKKGLGDSDLRSNVGELYLANISVPPNLYTRPPLNLKIPSLFVTSDVIKLQFG